MNTYMEAAIKEAQLGIDHGHGGPFGAVIVKNNEIIGRGHNEVIKNNDPTCHGEIMAIRDACKNLKTYDLKGSVIYTTAFPCPMCLGAILWSNIDEIYYGCTIEDTEEIGFRDSEFYEKSKPENIKKYIKQMSHDECLKIYQDYKNKPNKKDY